MLSYQHGYHAGNFADVVKHVTLSRLFNYLCQKEKPIFYLETHAGKGHYDLQSQQSLKTGEAREGIEQLWMHQESLSTLFLPYLNTIRYCNQNNEQPPPLLSPQGSEGSSGAATMTGTELRYYPGSPQLALHQLRAIDRLFCCELHPQEYQALQQLKTRDMRIHLSHTDGLQQLGALLPPPERRGLVFIDPSFEMKSDYQQIPKFVNAAFQRFNTGMYCIWYPIVDKKWHLQLVEHLKNIKNSNFLQVEFYLTSVLNAGMTGCGLWIINPPYVLADELNIVLTDLIKLMNPGFSSYRLNESSKNENSRK